jgi:ABC-type phosphate/phosphonate transport system substrate-binding protein
MSASLPMYDLPCVRVWTDAWWQGLRRAAARHGFAGLPQAPIRQDDRHALWQAPDLALSQICGYAVAHGYRDRLLPVATPCYAAPGCDGPRYRSVILVREDSAARTLADLRDTACACNEPDSQSGTNSLARAVAPLAGAGSFFAGVVFTGAHVDSMALVRAGKAAVCAVDCVTHALLARHQPDAVAGLEAIGYTASAPGLPYVTGAATGADDLRRMREALFDALADPMLSEPREALLLAGAEVLTSQDYLEIAAWPSGPLGVQTATKG